MIPTIEWNGPHVRMIDQRKIPARIEWYVCRGYKDVIRGIQTMVIRGAPAIGVAAAMGLALGARSIRVKSYAAFLRKFQEMAGEMLLARPTAVNLRWAVERVSGLVEEMEGAPVEKIKSAIRDESQKMLDEDIEINRRMGKNGPSWSTVRDSLEAQGLPRDFLDEAPFTARGAQKVIGNGVPLPMGRAIAKAVREAMYGSEFASWSGNGARGTGDSMLDALAAAAQERSGELW